MYVYALPKQISEHVSLTMVFVEKGVIICSIQLSHFSFAFFASSIFFLPYCFFVLFNETMMFTHGTSLALHAHGQDDMQDNPRTLHFRGCKCKFAASFLVVIRNEVIVFKRYI